LYAAVQFESPLGRPATGIADGYENIDQGRIIDTAACGKASDGDIFRRFTDVDNMIDWYPIGPFPDALTCAIGDEPVRARRLQPGRKAVG
jgi:hypothetical protein